jgi:HlyD family secretion protein
MRLTLTALVPNGTAVRQGDVLVEFDPTAQLDEAREAKAKLADLQHQLEEKRAQVNSDSSKRMAEIREGETELGKALLQLKRGPVLAEIERKKAEIKAAAARERLASLNKSHEYRLEAEAASVKVLELKHSRQELVVERLENNIVKMTIRAPHDGMTALESVWRSGSMGPPQVGDQVWPNQPVVRIFDPTEMVVEAQINEPDMAALSTSANAKVFIDAYPDVTFDARLEAASPVATSGLESPVKSFTARFRIQQRDPRILPDLSSSLEIATETGKGGRS